MACEKTIQRKTEVCLHGLVMLMMMIGARISQFFSSMVAISINYMD
jgi:hypothetical protein